MIFHSDKGSLYFKPLDFLLLTGVAYLATGIAYGILTYNFYSSSAIYSLISIIISWLIFSKKSIIRCHFSIDRNLEWILLAFTVLCMLSILFFYIAAGPSYFTIDKVTRYTVGSQLIYLKTGYWGSLSLLTALSIEGSRRFITCKTSLYALALLIGIIEGDRQILLILCFTSVFIFWARYNICLIPRGMNGAIIVIFVMTFITFFFKPIFYILFLGKHFDGGWFYASELFNWVRWEYYAKSNNIDISQVQINDIKYGLESIFLPFSSVDSSSRMWFNNVLGHKKSIGLTYGYSGTMWLGRWLPGLTIALPWFALCFLIHKITQSKDTLLKYLLLLPLVFLLYRLFRSEWVLLLKLYLWLFLYPSLIIYYLSYSIYKHLKTNHNY